MQRILSLWLLLSIAACHSSSEEKADHTTNASRPTAPTTTQHAQGFDITYGEGYKLVSVFHPFVDQPDTLQYVLLTSAASLPPSLQALPQITLPVKRMVILSTTHLGFLAALQSTEVIVGMAGTEYVYHPTIRQRVQMKQIASLNEQGLDEEAILALDPQLVMVSGMPQSDLGKYQKLIDLGIPVVINAVWLEASPLGKAEWIKFMAAFLDKESAANTYFEEIEKAYTTLLDKTKAIPSKERKSVLSGVAYQGNWYIPGGKSFMAHFFEDAAAIYPWQNLPESGSVPLSLEAVYNKALDTEVWLNVGNATSLEALEQLDERYGDFKAFQNGEVYNRTKRVHINGGNDYWEAGVVQPHLILADLIKILYPSLLPDHELYFYEKL